MLDFYQARLHFFPQSFRTPSYDKLLTSKQLFFIRFCAFNLSKNKPISIANRVINQTISLPSYAQVIKTD